MWRDINLLLNTTKIKGVIGMAELEVNGEHIPMGSIVDVTLQYVHLPGSKFGRGRVVC